MDIENIIRCIGAIAFILGTSVVVIMIIYVLFLLHWIVGVIGIGAALIRFGFLVHETLGN